MTAGLATRSVEMSERVLANSRKRPTKALAEAIRNALDVGADHVDVEFEFTGVLRILSKCGRSEPGCRPSQGLTDSVSSRFGFSRAA
jgi:hypothetical protein